MKKLPFDEKKYGEHKGTRFSLWVLFDDGSNDVQDFYLHRHIDNSCVHFKDWNKDGWYKKLLIYENEPIENRKYHFESFADYVGQTWSVADPSW